MNKLISPNNLHYENHLDEKIPKWFAIYTPFKREKIAARDLAKSGIKVYLPIHTVTRHYTKKTKKVDLPLINQYVFVKITTKEYASVFRCPYVLNFVKFSENLISIPDQEIELLKRISGDSTTTFIDSIHLKKGDCVEVIGGNLTGLRGILIEKENSQYISVQLTKIGISLNVSIAAHLLRKIKPGALINSSCNF